MRRAIGVVIVCTTTAHADPPAIEAALAHAGRRGLPLLVEFGAEWCPPCRDFEQHVLPSRDVVAALRAIEFVRYDVDRAPGDAAAARYRVDGYPTFLILEPDGTERLRRIGIGTGTPWFVALASQAREPGRSTAELEAAVADEPNNPAARMRLAERYRTTHRVADAAAEYRAIDQIPNLHRELAAQAAAALDDLTAADARIQGAVDAAVDFATRFPESPLTTRRLALIALSERVDAGCVHDLVTSHLAAVAPQALPDAVHVAMLAGASDEAALASADWAARAPDRPEPGLLRAEVALARGDPNAAKAIEARCRHPTGVEMWCHVLAFARRGVVPGVSQLRGEALATLRDLEEPGREAVRVSDGLVALSQDDAPFGNAATRAIDDAARDCRDAVARRVFAMVTIDLAPRGGRPLDVQIYARDHALERCLHDRIAQRELPPPPSQLDGRLSTMLRVDGRPKPVRTELVGSGALLFGTTRDGSGLETRSLGVDGVVDAAGLARDLRLLAAGHAEIGPAGDGTASYGARGFVGVGGARTRGALALFAGVGASRYGGVAPSAVELPIEARARFTIGSLRTHVWVRTTYLRGDTSRRMPTGAFLDADELALGTAVTIPFGGAAFAIGGGFETRRAGTSGVVLVGLPIGAYF